MKVELSDDGTLRVTAETALESFALSHWHTLYIEGKTSFLMSVVQVSPQDGAHPQYTNVEPRS